MTVIDIQAHEDTINSICLIDDPFCYVTCSKDKKIKIWSFTNELLGEINTQPSISHIDKNKFDWKFKVDWEKLKEKEITEVIKIFEQIGGEPIKFDETKLEDMNQVKTNEEIALNLQQDKNLQTQKKDRKRFKPIEEQRKKIAEQNQEDKETNNTIDDQQHQEIKANISKVVNPILYNVGMTEMVRTLFEGNKATKEEEKEKTGKEKNVLDKKMLQGINKIQALNNNPLKSTNKNALYADKYAKSYNKNSNEESIYHYNNVLPKIKPNYSQNKYIMLNLIRERLIDFLVMNNTNQVMIIAAQLEEQVFQIIHYKRTVN